jgi:hypothetical protein
MNGYSKTNLLAGAGGRSGKPFPSGLTGLSSCPAYLLFLKYFNLVFF